MFYDRYPYFTRRVSSVLHYLSGGCALPVWSTFKRVCRPVKYLKSGSWRTLLLSYKEQTFKCSNVGANKSHRKRVELWNTLFKNDMWSLLESNGLINSTQHGFHNGRWCESVIVNGNSENGIQRCSLIGHHKVFDKVPHIRLSRNWKTVESIWQSKNGEKTWMLY